MNTAPLDFDARARFKAMASSISFDGLSITDTILGKTTLAGLLVDDNALTNAPQIIANIPGVSAPLKRVFETAFELARIPPIAANGSSLPSTQTVTLIGAAVGILIGVGVAIMVVD